MTINERLFVSGMINAFDRAVKLNDVEELMEILRKLGLSKVDIDKFLEQLRLKD